jgi:hypothetical protein
MCSRMWKTHAFRGGNKRRWEAPAHGWRAALAQRRPVTTRGVAAGTNLVRVYDHGPVEACSPILLL